MKTQFTIASMSDMENVLKKFDLTCLSCGINAENDKHIPSPGCAKLAYISVKTIVKTR